MNTIVYLEPLYNSWLDMNVGFVGRDFNTSQKCYFTHFNEDNIFMGENYLRKFDPQKNLKKPWLETVTLPFSDSKNIYFMRKLLNDCFFKHIKYNQENDLPTYMLEDNKKNYKTSFMPQLFVNSPILINGAYNILENSIITNIDETSYKKLSLKDKYQFFCVLLHEVGHLKASLLQLENNYILVKTGFYQLNIPIHKFWGTQNEQIIIYNNVEPDINAVILEEIFNDLDCLKIDSNYISPNPKFGKVLDIISQGKLKSIRYEKDALEKFYNYLYNLNHDEKMLVKLMDCIVKSYENNSYFAKEAKKEAFKILKKYEQGRHYG